MLKTSLYLVLVAVTALLLADMEISAHDPWAEIQRILFGAITPDLSVLLQIHTPFLNTIAVALCGTAIAVITGTCLAFGFDLGIVRCFCAFIRAIHEIFWAFLLLPALGFTPICGVLAIAIPYSGILAKVYAGIRQDSDRQPIENLPVKSTCLSRFCYGSLPLIYRDLKEYTANHFECALRSSAVLGFIGLPTLGFHLETALRERLYSEAAAILYAFFLLILSKRYWNGKKVILSGIILSFVFLFREVSFNLDNVARFLTDEVLSRPMRRAGLWEKTGEVIWASIASLNRVWDGFKTSGLEGIFNTIVLTQIVLLGTALTALFTFPLACRHFNPKTPRRLSHFFLVILRTTPTYMLGYLLVQLYGPSMLAAVIAISLHNGAILAYLSSQSADRVNLRFDGPEKRVDRYFFEILPRIYDQFLAFLFYRWQIMMRESAIFGILGIYTLGFLIDSAIADYHLDTAVLLIVVTALLNIGIDSLSQLIGRHLGLRQKINPLRLR